jgi:hypothetical protein
VDQLANPEFGKAKLGSNTSLERPAFSKQPTTNTTINMKTIIPQKPAGPARCLAAAVIGFASTLAVTALANSPYAGVYNGSYATTSGSPADNGGIAVYVDPSGWAGFVHYSLIPDGGGSFNEGFAVSSGGAFNFGSSGGTAISGQISGGALTGTFTGNENSGTFSASRRSATGTYQSSAGYYEGTTAGNSGTASLRVILAADGTFYGAADDNSGIYGTLNDNQFSLTNTVGTYVTGSLNPTAHTFTGNWSNGQDSGTFTLYLTALTGPMTPWPDATDLGNGKMQSSWFGVFNETYYPWIWHQQHGWMYVFGTDPSSIWLYNETGSMGFLWTGSTVYPWMWSDTEQTWLYYGGGTAPNRYFYNWNAQQWETH